MKKKLMACAAFWLPTLALTGCGSQFGDKMVRAGMNTLMGMGTVFVVLIFIAFLISRFKYISQLENWFRNRKTKNEQAVLLKNRRQMRKKLMKRMIWLLWQ